MKKIHKQNLIITWCSVLALSLVSVLGYGLSMMALKGSLVVIISGIISTVGYFSPLPDDKKALLLVFPPAIGTLFYSLISGGNSIPYLANFVQEYYSGNGSSCFQRRNGHRVIGIFHQY